MTPPIDRSARDRFTSDFDANFAVNANAGSGKTTAISQRLAQLASLERGRAELPRTVVVTFTRKAASEIAQRARHTLLARLRATGAHTAGPVELLDRAFFGTIHSFCLTLVRRHGQTFGTHLAPEVLDDTGEERVWEDFLEEDPMTFVSTGDAELKELLRLLPWQKVLDLARELGRDQVRRLLARPPPGPRPPPNEEAWDRIQLADTKNAQSRNNLARSREILGAWREALRTGDDWLGFPAPIGSAAKIADLFEGYYAPVKRWAAATAARLAAELAERYRLHRFRRGVQSYADQVETAAALLREPAVLEAIRAEGYRVILDEAQDTDPQQFAVLVEIARPPGAPVGEWPGRGSGPRPGHFCMVGDGQQSIYGGRADIRNYQRHLEALRTDPDGDVLEFSVSFRVPRAAVPFLNAGFAAAFGWQRAWNIDTGSGALLQVPYQSLAAGPTNADGAVSGLTLPDLPPPPGKSWSADAALAYEARALAQRLRQLGPAALGAQRWSDVCILAPRNAWLRVAAQEFERAGLRTALQVRQVRNRDQPPYAWATGLLTVACDPENGFEWAGVLREVFAVSDATLAATFAGGRALQWDDPEAYTDETLRAALATVRPFVLRVDDEGETPARWWRQLRTATRLDARAKAADSTGAWLAELDRVDSIATSTTAEGGDIRAFAQALRDGLEETRPAGSPSDDAINLVTSHSAKGLEWPVAIPLGWWRRIGRKQNSGLSVIEEPGGEPTVYFDAKSLPGAMAVARENERLRELGRLLYVTLTRARFHLVLPRGGGFERLTRRTPGRSFAELWGNCEGAADIASLPETGAGEWAKEPPSLGGESPVQGATVLRPPAWEPAKRRLARDPARLVPHRLAQTIDRVRDRLERTAGSVLDTESRLSPPIALAHPGAVDPLVYGVWWHETMEHLPWSAEENVIDAHLAIAVERADQGGFGERAREELAKLRDGPVWHEVRQPAIRVRTELPVFLPAADGSGWIDGVVDFVVEKPDGSVWVVDWKTNRRRPGESDDTLLARLREEYAPQLNAYREILGPVFSGRSVAAWLVATATGRAIRCDS